SYRYCSECPAVLVVDFSRELTRIRLMARKNDNMIRTPLLALLFLTSALSAQPTTRSSGEKPFGVRIVGHGRPMILIPGLACSGEVWDATVDHFKDRYECHILTLAGFAGQPPVQGPWLQTVANGLADYIRQKKLDRPVIVGHSI